MMRLSTMLLYTKYEDSRSADDDGCGGSAVSIDQKMDDVSERLYRENNI